MNWKLNWTEKVNPFTPSVSVTLLVLLFFWPSVDIFPREFIIIIILYLGRSSRGGRQKLILEFIALMVSHPSDDYYYYFNTPDSIDPRGKKN